MPTEYYHTTVWLNQNGDTRKTASIRTDFTLPNGRVPGLSWTGQVDELEPHTRKFEDIRTNGSQNFWYSGGIIYYLRLADILLCKAECLNETNKTTEAINLVNSTVRTRAYAGNLPSNQRWGAMSQAEFRNKIMDERMRELAFEGWRRMDLIRTGKLVELAGKYNPWTKESATIQAFHKWYPIPESEIKQNDAINEGDQNVGYNQQ